MTVPLRLLIVEDRPADAELMLAELRRAGFEPDWRRVETEADYLAALDPTVDLILSDYHLPQFSGPRALALLRKSGLDVPLIVLSGAVDEDVIAECVVQGAADYLLKQRLARLGPAVTRALEARRLRAERRQAEALTRGLVEVSRELAETLDLGQVADRVVATVLRLFRARYAALWRLDRDAATLVCTAAAGDGEAAQWVGQTLKVGTGVSSRAIAEARVVWIPDLLADPRTVIPAWMAEKAAAENLRAVAAVPLETRGEVLGTLVLGDSLGRVLTEEEIGLLQAFADQAAVALVNARLYEDAEERRREAEVLAQLTGSISGSLDLDVILQRVADGARDLCRGDAARIALWEPDRRTMVPRHRSGSLHPNLRELRLEPGKGLAGQVMLTGRPARTANYSGDPRFSKDYLEAARADGVIAMIAVPIRVEDRVEGLLFVDRHTPRAFTDREEAILVQLADHAALAIRNARLYAERTQAWTELSRTQHQLVQAQKMEAIGRLAGGVAHDFNNLLTVIQGRAQLLATRLAPGDPLRRHVDLAQGAATRAAALTRQLLAFSRKQVLQPRVLDLNALLSDMKSMLRRLIAEDIELVPTLDPSLGRIQADPTQLEQVVLNLAVNARDAMPQGGRLGLETANVELDDAFAEANPGARPGPHVRLTVRDTGVGMDAEVLSHVFEPFFTTKGPGKGTGLGLATVYGIVKQSDGYVAVESAPGRGTAFDIYLPRVEHAVEASDREERALQSSGGSETVLLVEDDGALRDLTREILEAYGYAVLEAANGPAALEVADRYPDAVHLLVTDVVMPQMSGRELAERLLARRPELRVLYMSGYSDDFISRHGVLDAGVALLAKPFTPDALAAKVREVLDAGVRP